jgi:hypothetical protein
MTTTTTPAPAAAPTADPLAATVPSALALGWAMATIYSPPATFGLTDVDHLLTTHELPEEDRITVELESITCLLANLAHDGVTSLGDASTMAGDLKANWDGPAAGDGQPAPPPPANRVATLHAALPGLNLALLEGFACAGSELELAYEVGRSLRDTASMPPKRGGGQRSGEELVQALTSVLGSERISTIRQWLATLATHLPTHAASVVSTSLGRWSEMAGAAIDSDRPGGLKATQPPVAFARSMQRYLLRQGDVWLQLLVGTRTAAGLLDPEGYVAAGELALRRTTRILRRILKHYWVGLVILAAALGGVLYLSAEFIGGAGKVWTDIAAIATSLGVTAKGIGSTTARLAKEAERPIFGLEEEDVMAWAVTALPPARLDGTALRAVRRAGVAPSHRLLRNPRSRAH